MRFEFSCDVKNAGVAVDANEFADVGKPLRGHPRDDTGAARRIQHAITCMEFDMVEHSFR
jgi:hypothetical protein